MERRLYFLIPDRAQALAVVDDLVGHGIDIDHMHAIGDQHTRMDGLPGIPTRGSRSGTSSLQQLAWTANTVCFAVAVVAICGASDGLHCASVHKQVARPNSRPASIMETRRTTSGLAMCPWYRADDIPTRSHVPTTTRARGR